MARFLAYSWPGNVREMKNVVERLVATVEWDLIRRESLPAEIRGSAPAAVESGEAPGTAEELKEAKRLAKEAGYARVEKEFVLKALERSGWNVTRAAAQVGMARPNFHALMRKHGGRARGDDAE